MSDLSDLYRARVGFESDPFESDGPECFECGSMVDVDDRDWVNGKDACWECKAHKFDTIIKMSEAVTQLIAAASSVRARLDPPTQEESMRRVKALDDALSNLRKELE